MPSATTKTLTDQLRRDYSYVLFQISQNLGREHTNKFRRLCTGHILNTNTTEITSMFHCFEHEGLISWKDINYLKDLMRKIRRFDIEREVTEFEIYQKRSKNSSGFLCKEEARSGPELLFPKC